MFEKFSKILNESIDPILNTVQKLELVKKLIDEDKKEEAKQLIDSVIKNDLINS